MATNYVGFCQGDCGWEGAPNHSLPAAYRDALVHTSETDKTHRPGVREWEHPQLFNDRRDSDG